MVESKPQPKGGGEQKLVSTQFNSSGFGLTTLDAVPHRPSSFRNTAYKAYLMLDIVGTLEIDGNLHYKIRITRQVGEQVIYQEVYKRYSNLYDAYEKLQAQYENLPEFPRKRVNLFMTSGAKEERQLQLLNYMREVLCRRDTRNSIEVIQILELQQFCPETLYNRPKLLMNSNFKSEKKFVSHCLFLDQYSIYFVVLADRTKKVSWLEAYAFKQTGVVSDSYVIRSSTTDRKTNPEDASRPSVHEALNQPGARTNSFQQEGQANTQLVSKNQVTCLMQESFGSVGRITQISFCDNLTVLVLGFNTGVIITMQVSIERAPLFSAEAAEKQEQNNNSKINALKSKTSTANNRFDTQDNLLAFKYFWQSECDTPELDLENSKWTTAGTNSNASGNQNNSSSQVKRQYSFTLNSLSRSLVHKSKVKEMLIDQAREHLYLCCGTTISVFQLEMGKPTFLKLIKSKNMRPCCMVLDEGMQRLYVGTKEGMLIVFDTCQKSIVMEHHMRMIKNGSRNYIKQMDLDQAKSILMCRFKPSSSIICIQIIQQNMHKSTVIEKVQTYNDQGSGEQISKYKWLSRMAVYIEGTTRGLIKIRDIQKNGECLMHLKTDFSISNDSRIQLLGYNQTKNILFASCREGGFHLWKVSHEWRNKTIDQEEHQAFVNLKYFEKNINQK